MPGGLFIVDRSGLKKIPRLLALGRKSWPRILLFADFLPSPPHFPDFRDFQEFPANPLADQDVLAASVVPVRFRSIFQPLRTPPKPAICRKPGPDRPATFA